MFNVSVNERPFVLKQNHLPHVSRHATSEAAASRGSTESLAASVARAVSRNVARLAALVACPTAVHASRSLSRKTTSSLRRHSSTSALSRNVPLSSASVANSSLLETIS